MRFDDEDYPLLDWAADRDVIPDRNCTLCWGQGVDDRDLPCRCLAEACFTVFPAAADEAEPLSSCSRCDGDGEDFEGNRCLCLIVDLRRIQDSRETAED